MTTSSRAPDAATPPGGSSYHHGRWGSVPWTVHQVHRQMDLGAPVAAWVARLVRVCEGDQHRAAQLLEFPVADVARHVAEAAAGARVALEGVHDAERALEATGGQRDRERKAAAIVALVAACGDDRREAARLLGIGPKAVEAWQARDKRARGVEPRPYGQGPPESDAPTDRTWQPWDRADLLTALRDDRPVAELAAEMRRTARSVRQVRTRVRAGDEHLRDLAGLPRLPEAPTDRGSQPWTRDDVLTAMRDDASIKDLAAGLRRPWRSLSRVRADVRDPASSRGAHLRKLAGLPEP